MTTNQTKGEKMTKAQSKTCDKLEKKWGYDFSHTSQAGNPVLVLREKGTYVEIFPNGQHGPEHHNAAAL